MSNKKRISRKLKSLKKDRIEVRLNIGLGIIQTMINKIGIAAMRASKKVEYPSGVYEGNSRKIIEIENCSGGE